MRFDKNYLGSSAAPSRAARGLSDRLRRTTPALCAPARWVQVYLAGAGKERALSQQLGDSDRPCLAGEICACESCIDDLCDLPRSFHLASIDSGLGRHNAGTTPMRFGGTPCIAAGRNPLPSRRHKMPSCASQTRTAFANMTSNTGCKSPGELEMTPPS